MDEYQWIPYGPSLEAGEYTPWIQFEPVFPYGGEHLIIECPLCHREVRLNDNVCDEWEPGVDVLYIGSCFPEGQHGHHEAMFECTSDHRCFYYLERDKPAYTKAKQQQYAHEVAVDKINAQLKERPGMTEQEKEQHIKNVFT